MLRTMILPLVVVLFAAVAMAAEPPFAEKPAVSRAGGKVTITFTLAKPADVEVAVLNSDGAVVRHLAAGMVGVGAQHAVPIRAGLEQRIVWDGKDDFGKAAKGAPFRARVRTGTQVALDKFIGGDPYTFGSIAGVAADEDGNVYALGYGGLMSQSHMSLRKFDPKGRYVRELLPFAADLAPGAMKDVARWDGERKGFFLRNHSGLNPRAYHGGCLTLVSVSKTNGITLTDGTRLYRLNIDGSVKGAKFNIKTMWEKKLIPWGGLPNSGKGPTCLAVSRDGKFAYLSGPFTCKDRYGHQLNPAIPPGRVYRCETAGSGKMKEFVTVPVAHKNGVGGNWPKGMGYGFGPKGPVHGIAVDKSGNVYVCDRERGRISVYTPAGKDAGHVPVKYADQVALHSETGAIYVMQRDRVAYGKWYAKLLKFEKLGADQKPAATHDFGPNVSSPKMALSVSKDSTVMWVAGVPGGLMALEDKGKVFSPVATAYKPKPGAQREWNRMAVDYGRDEIYVNNGGARFWRYDGATGKGGLLVKSGRPFYSQDLSIGYDGRIYARMGTGKPSGQDYSGSFARFDRDLNPAPFDATGTHVMSKYIYSRYGIAYAERGVGVGPRGESYLSWMYGGWVKYALTGFDANGKPMQGKYLVGGCGAANHKAGTPRELNSAVIGPIPGANGGIRVDLQGNIYLGMLVWPKGMKFPKGFEKDRGYFYAVGSVVKFGPEGGSVGVVGKKKDGETVPEGVPMAKGELIQGMKAIYPGIAPYSKSPFGTTCCVCRTPRFDLDRYGRLVMPNAVTHSVRLVDNAGNLILEFGNYGNFDSQYVNPLAEVEDGEDPKPTVATPAIPVGWPTGAGFTGKHIYVNDTRNRRVLRLKLAFAAEEICGVK